MHKLITAIAFLLLFSISAKAGEIVTDWKFVRVIDGDTVVFEIPDLPVTLSHVVIRVLGIDTPERHSKCAAERKLADKARLRVVELIGNGKRLVVWVKGWDKYGGRVLGTIQSNGVDLGEDLISRNLARAYHGENKKLFPLWPGCK